MHGKATPYVDTQVRILSWLQSLIVDWHIPSVLKYKQKSLKQYMLNSQVAEGIEVTRSLVDAHIHTGMTQYCITVSYKFESCSGYKKNEGIV